ncbi:MAG: hypothetical protein GC171_11815 [Terrimonas sp.]|nr:hypothetical protein [Terrimonas sp.]
MDQLFEQLTSEYGLTEMQAIGIIDTVEQYLMKNRMPYLSGENEPSGITVARPNLQVLQGRKFPRYEFERKTAGWDHSRLSFSSIQD